MNLNLGRVSAASGVMKERKKEADKSARQHGRG